MLDMMHNNLLSQRTCVPNSNSDIASDMSSLLLSDRQTLHHGTYVLTFADIWLERPIFSLEHVSSLQANSISN